MEVIEVDHKSITYDTFEYKRKTPKAAAIKVKKGYKICRYAQNTEDWQSIMPSVSSKGSSELIEYSHLAAVSPSVPYCSSAGSLNG